MNVTIGMIVLNEEEYIARNLQQHYEYADSIVIVEGADQLYPKHNITAEGLSGDHTAEIIRSFPDPDKKIKFIQHGWIKKTGEQAKCEIRSRYLEDIKQGLLVVIDADEFYTHTDLVKIIAEAEARPKVAAWQYPQVHFWHGTDKFVTGGYFDVPHCRIWQIRPGDGYENNHNSPSRNGKELRKMYTIIKTRVVAKCEPNDPLPPGKCLEYMKGPVCYHFGFAKNRQDVKDKCDYYINRGERKTRYRYVKSRASFFTPDDKLYSRLAIHLYGGPLPECFVQQGQQVSLPIKAPSVAPTALQLQPNSQGP